MQGPVFDDGRSQGKRDKSSQELPEFEIMHQMQVVSCPEHAGGDRTAFGDKGGLGGLSFVGCRGQPHCNPLV